MSVTTTAWRRYAKFARTALAVLAGIFAFDLQLAYFSGHAFFVTRSTALTNAAIVVTIAFLGYLLASLVGLLTRVRNTKQVLIGVFGAVAFGITDTLLIFSLLSQERGAATMLVTSLAQGMPQASVSFSDSHIEQQWKGETPSRLRSCMIGEAPFQRKFIFKLQGERSAYLVVAAVAPPAELLITPLKEAPGRTCIE